MKKIISCILIIVMILSVSSGVLANEKRILKVCTSAQFAPFEYYDESGELTGFDIELMNRLAQILGYEIKYSEKPFDALFLSIMSGETDCAISAITVTEERQKSLYYTQPYLKRQNDGGAEKFAITVVSNELREELDTALDAARADGTIEKLMAKYELDKSDYSPYENVPSDWAKESVNTAKSVGVTERTKEYFYQNKITREEFCDLIYNTIKVVLKKTYTINTSFKFEDTDNEAVLILSKLGIVNGKTATEFAPNDFLTREEAATIIVRMINSLMPFPVTKMWFEYDDISDISQWASDSVQAISNLGFMNGVGDNKFAPKDTYTTQQAIATLVRVYECAKENGIINEVSIIGGADKPTQILVTDTVKVDEFYIDEALKLTREAGELAADSEFISYYTPDEKIKERISAIGAENWSKPQEIYYISANRDKIVAFAEALLGKDAKNIDIDKFTELYKLNYIQLAAMINASYGTENLAALTILANSEGYIMPKDFEKSFALYLQYDGQYSALVSFSKYGEGVISANMSFVKNGDKDNVFSRIYEITQGLGEESVAVAKVKGE